jgi:hypothetical protein
MRRLRSCDASALLRPIITNEVKDMTARDPTHPVWDVYDQFRTARLNAKYFSCRAASLERWNFWLELVLAATATGSAIAGFTFWQTRLGQPIWQSLMVAAALGALVKPLLRLTERVKTAQEAAGAYRGVEYDLRRIEVAIKQSRTYDRPLQERFANVLERMSEVATKDHGHLRVNKRLLTKCQAEVENELPSTHFFIPKRIEQ